MKEFIEWHLERAPYQMYGQVTCHSLMPAPSLSGVYSTYTASIFKTLNVEKPATTSRNANNQIRAPYVIPLVTAIQLRKN